jgi:tRNA nucleotidyltransferase (CCA-adding enzyme)
MQGKDIQNLLGVKPGPIIKEISNSVMEWQLKYPNNSKEECQEFIKHKYEKF